MIWQDRSARNFGVNFQDGQALISMWAPHAKTLAIVAGSEKIELEKKNYGFWQAQTHRLHPGDLYKYLLNNDQLLPDPASLHQPFGVHGPSMAVDLKALNHDANWTTPPLEQYIIYELHAGCFSAAGNFQGIEEKLHYLKELGITAIEIMPVAEFAGNRNWGYDGVYPFAVHHSYGGYQGLQQLVKACHRLGIAVILDVVYNHLGPEGNYLPLFGPCFTGKYQTPWGHALNFDDEWCDGLRQFFIENALMWFRDFHVDALRLDAVHAIKDFSAKHILQEIREEVDKLQEKTGNRYYLIAECDLNDPKFINPLPRGGYGMHAQWIDEFHHSLRVSAGQQGQGYYSDFNGVAHLAKAFSDAYVFDGQFSAHRKKFFGLPAKENAAVQFVVFSQNHDQVGNRAFGERSSSLYSFEMQKLLAAAVILSPYLPLLFMGEEWGETNPFLYFVSHSDEKLAQNVKEGRKKEFAAFYKNMSGDEIPDPLAAESFLRSKLQWQLKDEEPHKTLLNFYKSLIALRKQHPVLKSCNRKNLSAHADEIRKMVFVKRWHENKEVEMVFNFSDAAQPFSPRHDQTIVLNSAAKQWKGPIENSNVLEQDFFISAESVLVLEGSLKETQSP